jgi:hypothetical protein
VFLGFLLGGMVMLWLSLGSLIPTIHAIGQFAPLVAFTPFETRGRGLALSAFALAAMVALPWTPDAPGSAKRKKITRSNRRMERVAFALLCVCPRDWS